ncbi:MAG TPA: 7-carboxy-7-deazaguanine synthase QueE [Armatimonadota bacterium]|jgi:organic radical activating enzyme
MGPDTHSVMLHEIFSGIQGEGVLVGYRQIFVRFHGCNLHCAYCDTPASRGDAPASCAVERAPGSRDLEQWPNPLSVTQIVDAIHILQAGYPQQTVSFTGGEPLLQRALLDALLPRLHADGIRTLLETNGLLADALAALAVMPSYVAMDMKLPSTAGIAPQWAQHAAFLAVAHARQAGGAADALQVKLVFGEDSLADVAQAAALIAACDATIPCVLQPVTPRPGGPASPCAATVLEAQRRAAGLLAQVRVIPQTHVMLGQW